MHVTNTILHKSLTRHQSATGKQHTIYKETVQKIQYEQQDIASRKQINNVTKTYGAVRLHQTHFVPREVLRRQRDMFRLTNTKLYFGNKVSKTNSTCVHIQCDCVALFGTIKDRALAPGRPNRDD